LKVLDKGKIGESYNISADHEFDVFQIVKKILSYMEKPEDAYYIAEDRPGHDDRYSMDSSKIRKELDWSPKVDFEQGLKESVDWYLENKSWWLNYDKNILEKVQWK
jgi:dTDP-glucose 4,6-dehydratase